MHATTVRPLKHHNSADLAEAILWAIVEEMRVDDVRIVTIDSVTIHVTTMTASPTASFGRPDAIGAASDIIDAMIHDNGATVIELVGVTEDGEDELKVWYLS